MFEAKLEDGTHLKKLIESMKDLFTDVNFDCTAAGISCQAMDSSHVCLCSVLLKADSFDPYRCDRNLTLGMNCVTLSKILKCAGNDESITVRAEDNADTVSFVYEKPNQERVSKFEMKVMDIDSEHLGIPDQEYDAIIRLPSHEFSRICRDLSQFGDTVTIAATKDGIRFSCSGETGNGSITLRQSSSVDSKEDEEVSIELNEAVTQTYAMRFLILFSKVIFGSVMFHAELATVLVLQSSIAFLFKNNDCFTFRLNHFQRVSLCQFVKTFHLLLNTKLVTVAISDIFWHQRLMMTFEMTWNKGPITMKDNKTKIDLMQLFY